MEIPIHTNRYEDQILRLEAHPVQNGGVLFYGSSFFANWGYDRARAQMAAASGGALRVTNHGFGGAFVDELLYYYPRLVRPVAPEMVVLRPAFNDLNNGMRAEDCLFLTKRLLAWLKTDFPQTKVVILKVFDTAAAGEKEFAEMILYNAMVDALVDGMVSALDLNPFFYENEADIGTRLNFRDVFLPDRLHLTDAGYEQMAQFLAKKLM